MVLAVTMTAPGLAARTTSAVLSSHTHRTPKRLQPITALIPHPLGVPALCTRSSSIQTVAPITIQQTSLRSSKVQRQRSLLVKAKVNSGKAFKTTVVPDADFRIPAVLLGTSAALFALDQKLVAAPVGLLGVLLAFQTTRVRFQFDEESLEVVIGEKAESSGENVFVGGENRWRYDTFTNWEFWWPNFPVLVYFKETQTKPEGQIHFFPIIANGKQLYDVMVERCGPSMTSGPKDD